MPEDHFAGDVARTYDDHVAGEFDEATVSATVDLLVDLCADGAALEFAVGTGRLALPLAARGVPVSGIDLSADMVAQIRQKPGGADLPVVVGDMTSVRVEGDFGLAYLVFNSLLNLTSQDQQVACFENAARHLEPGGRFVVEAIVPRLQHLPTGERFQPFTVTADHVGIDEVDVVTQRAVSHHFVRDGDVYRRRSMPFRYVWPSELDLMARIAGMDLEARWSSWDRAPFTATSDSHISVWTTQA